MVKPKSAKVDMSSNRRDTFFIRPKGNAFKQNSRVPSSYKKKNFVSHDDIQKPSTSTSDDFFITKSDTDVGGFLDKNDKKKQGVEKNDGKKPAAEKRPFDKKKWRLQKYSKKYKLQQWEEKRKQVVTREYYKQIKHEKPGFDVKKIYETEDPEDDESEDKQQENERMVKKRPTVHERYQQLQQEKKDKKAEALKKQEEIKAAREAYKKKKAEKYKKLGLRTKKGQPVMKHRMEMLLEEIMNTCT